MIFISVTRLRLRSFLLLPKFLMMNGASSKVLVATPGFLVGKELIDKQLTFWTVTAWTDIDAMKSFRNSVPHRKAIQKLPFWCDEGAYAHWEQDSEELPDWTTVYTRIMTEGKLTKVKKPSLQQISFNYPKPKWRKTERVFRRSA